MTDIDKSWIASQRTRSESNDQWKLRRSFIEKYVNDYPHERLVCLSQVFANRIYLKCTYQPGLTDLVERMAKGLAEEHPELVPHPPEPADCVLSTVEDDEDDDVEYGVPPEADQLPLPQFGPLQKLAAVVENEQGREPEASGDSMDEEGSVGDDDRMASASETTILSEGNQTVKQQAPEKNANADGLHEATSGESAAAVCESMKRLEVKKKRRTRRKRVKGKEAGSGDEAEDEDSPPVKDTLMTPPPSPTTLAISPPAASEIPQPPASIVEAAQAASAKTAGPESPISIPPSPEAKELPLPRTHADSLQASPPKGKPISEHISCGRRLRSLLYVGSSKQSARKHLERAVDMMRMPMQMITDGQTGVTTLDLDGLLVVKHKFAKDSDIEEAISAAAVYVLSKNDWEIREPEKDHFEVWRHDQGPQECYESYWKNCLTKAGKKITDENPPSATETLRSALKELGEKFEVSYTRPKGQEQQLELRVGDVILAQKALSGDECKNHKQVQESLALEVLRKIRGQIAFHLNDGRKYVLN